MTTMQGNFPSRRRVGKNVDLLLALALASLAAICCAVSRPAAAQTPTAPLAIELNQLTGTPAGCKIAFVATNKMPVSVDKISFETVFFNEKGLVNRIATLDFQSLPEGKTRVRQFTLPNIDCQKISRILINDIAVCEGDGLTPDVCASSIVTTSKSAIEFGS